MTITRTAAIVTLVVGFVLLAMGLSMQTNARTAAQQSTSVQELQAGRTPGSPLILSQDEVNGLNAGSAAQSQYEKSRLVVGAGVLVLFLAVGLLAPLKPSESAAERLLIFLGLALAMAGIGLLYQAYVYISRVDVYSNYQSWAIGGVCFASIGALLVVAGLRLKKANALS